MTSDGYPRFETASSPARVAVVCAKALGRISRLWRQRGLGTIYKFARRAPLLGDAQCIVELLPGSFFQINVFEPYWGPTVVGGRPFETELLHVFRRVAHRKPVLIDAGANYGYWSVIATSREIGFPKAIAIEASPSTYEILRENARLNGNRFQTLNRAVIERSGEIVRLEQTGGHVVTHVSASGTGAQVESTSIDDAVRSAGLWNHDVFVLKLDIEGQKVNAIAGAKALRAEKEHLICFEDFPMTGPNGFAAVRSIIGQGYAVWFVAADAKCQRVADDSSLVESVERHREVGFSRNFWATWPGSEMDVLFATWERDSTTSST